MIKLIIFDLDGLLVDSQPLQYKARNAAFAKHGFPISEEDWWNEWVQNSANSKVWVERLGVPLDPEQLSDEARTILKELIGQELKLKPGANYAIDLLREKYRLCIASASRSDILKSVAEKFDFTSRFEWIVSDADAHVRCRKPCPDIFLYVVDHMKVQSSECVVVEDSAAGLIAAKAAGMKCIVCPDSGSPIPTPDYSQADKVIQTLDEITVDMIEKL